MFKNIGLRYRILLGYSIPLLLLIAVVAVASWKVQTASQRSGQVHLSNENIQKSNDLFYNGTRLEWAARAYLLNRNEQSVQSFQEGERIFETLSETLPRIVIDPGQRDLLSGMIVLFRQLHDEDRRLMALVDAGRESEALEAFRSGKTREMVREVEKKIKIFKEEETRIMAVREGEEDAAIRTVIQVLLWGAVFSVVLALGIGLWMAARISKAILANTSLLSSTSVEIASTIDEHERTAAQQSAMVNQTTATVNELGVSSRQSAEQATAAAEVAKQALSLTEEGSTAVKQTIDGMDHLKERIQAVADKILLLGDFTVQIGNIANLVKDLADQTNMLALNAAVEAVRAGEHGKGFAVLAGEVRKLADESKKSAEHANTLISDIQKATNAAIMVTEEGTKTVDEVTGLARKVGTLFDNLAESSNNVFEKAQQVLLNTRQQSTALNQVVDAINSINTGARETAAGITQTKVGVDRLKEAAQGLQTVVYGSGNGRVPR